MSSTIATRSPGSTLPSMRFTVPYSLVALRTNSSGRSISKDRPAPKTTPPVPAPLVDHRPTLQPYVAAP